MAAGATMRVLWSTHPKPHHVRLPAALDGVAEDL